MACAHFEARRCHLPQNRALSATFPLRSRRLRAERAHDHGMATTWRRERAFACPKAQSRIRLHTRLMAAATRHARFALHRPTLESTQFEAQAYVANI